MITRTCCVLLSLAATLAHVQAFTPASTQQRLQSASFSKTRPTTQLHLAAAAAVLPSNPFRKLPWNVKKEQERQARKLKQERNQLFRKLGIPEDATYEEIVAATDNLIEAAGSDMKQKVKIEVAKDQILQIRLNERLAGLTTLTKEARAQSSFEMEGYVLMITTIMLCCFKTRQVKESYQKSYTPKNEPFISHKIVVVSACSSVCLPFTVILFHSFHNNTSLLVLFL